MMINPSEILIKKVIEEKTKNNLKWSDVSQRSGLSRPMVENMESRLRGTCKGLTFWSAVSLANAVGINLHQIQKEVEELEIERKKAWDAK